MLDCTVLSLAEAVPGQRQAMLAGCRWLTRLVVVQSRGPLAELRTSPGEEAALLVLSGTHDLAAGASSWAARGVRASPEAGRPVAVFVPPQTLVRATNGSGELLLFGARQPPPKPGAGASAPTGLLPQLPIAGSNKVYDRDSGTWQMAEALPGSAEAILPRRIAQETRPGLRLERVMPMLFKASGLTVLEAVLEPGVELVLPDHEQPPCGTYPEEWAVYTRGALTLRQGDHVQELRGESVAAGSGEARLCARERTFAVVAGAGRKPV